ncbi:MAG: hypothetical protein ACK6C0_02620, partial [Betaproteobacteria bacterium]
MPLRRDLGRPRTLPAKGFRPNRINLHEKYDYPELERPVLRALPHVAPDLLPDGTRDEHVIAIPERPAVRYPDRSMAQAGAHRHHGRRLEGAQRLAPIRSVDQLFPCTSHRDFESRGQFGRLPLPQVAQYLPLSQAGIARLALEGQRYELAEQRPNAAAVLGERRTSSGGLGRAVRRRAVRQHLADA